MKKLFVVTFLFLYIASFVRPFAPTILNYIAKKGWENSHKNRVEKMNGRVNFLVVLADMAKHNSPRHDSTPQPNATKIVGNILSFIVPALNCSFCFNEVLDKFFPHYLFNNRLVFQQSTTPPPKSV